MAKISGEAPLYVHIRLSCRRRALKSLDSDTLLVKLCADNCLNHVRRETTP
jgi:hypothetical protein